MSRRKKSTFARGYGPAHQALRKRWTPQVEAGLVDCSRCGLRIDPGDFRDLDHADDRRGYLGPSHRKCNRATKGRNAGRRVSIDLGEGPRSRLW